ncbi:hypothetical protein DXG01_002613 [Tephrocybe rancida]|nr:hypothetical protein DXG01_002613 [Tephrocybe rancida]
MPSLRQSFYLLKFLQHRDTQGPREAHESQYAASEVRRDDAFQAARFEFRQEFVEAEKSQAAGEQERGDLFERLNSDLQETFDINQHRRERSYQESDTLQESTFQRNETKREAIFQGGQSNRATMYEKEHDSHVQRSTWFRDNRSSILVQGRQTREKSCVDMEAAFLNQFTRLSKIQEDSFALKEQERDAMVATLLTELPLNPESPDKTAPEPALPEIPVPFPEPTAVASYPPAPSTYIPFPSSTPVTPSATVQAYPSVVIDRRSRSRSPRSTRRRRTPQNTYADIRHRRASRSASRVTATSPLRLSLSKPEETFTQKGSIELADPFEERFHVAQCQRSEDFTDEEERREGLFKAAEAERDLAEGGRTQTFERKGRVWQQTFQDMLDAQKSHYNEKERSRTEVHMWRDDIYRVVQQRQADGFAMLIVEVEKQAQAEDSLEDGLCAELKYRMESVCSRQIRLLQAARKDQWDHFTMAQLRRRGELGLSLPILPSMSPRSRASNLESLAYSLNSSYESPVPHALGTLLVKGATTLKPLPLPGVEIKLNKIRVEKSFQGRQKKRQILFDRAQYRREQVFEKGMEERRRVFVVNEQRRVDDFEKQQRVRRDDFAERDDQRERQFKAVQQQREALFFTAERSREAKFHDTERAQTREFSEAQRDRSTRFHAKQQEIQTSFFATERTRLEDINAWGIRLLQKMERDGKAYELEEAEREDIFRASISSVHSQSC